MHQDRTEPTRGAWPLLRDVLLALVVGVASLVAAKMALVEWSGGPPGPGGYGMDGPPWADESAPLPWSIAPALVVIMVGVALRSRLPRAGFGLVLVGTAGYLALGHPMGPVLLAPALGLLALARAVPVASWRRLMPLVLPMLLVGLLARGPAALADLATWRALVVGSMFLGLVALLGILRRNRADAVRRQRVEELGRTAYEERLRIAREVHDVVGHSLSVISMQAGAALHVLDKRPDQVEQSLRAIRRSSRDALTELRTTLDVFHGTTGDGRRAPGPGLAQLDQLTDPLTELGREVVVTVDGVVGGTVPRLPAAVDHAAYRIVQESLTNILRHAPGAGARVRISTGQGSLRIEVHDDGPARTEARGIVPGHGIAGMQERARAVGGELQVDASAGYVVVRARLPIDTDTGPGPDPDPDDPGGDGPERERT